MSDDNHDDNQLILSPLSRSVTIPPSLFAKSVQAMKDGLERNKWMREDCPNKNNPYACPNFKACKGFRCRDVKGRPLLCDGKCTEYEIRDRCNNWHATYGVGLKPSQNLHPCRHEQITEQGKCKVCRAKIDQARVTANNEACKKRIRADKEKAKIHPHNLRIHALGIRVDALVAFAFDHDCWNMKTRDVVRDIIVPATGGGDNQCRYGDLPEMQGFFGPATVFMSHSWGARFGDLVGAASQGSVKDRFVWIDIFAVRQWPGNRGDFQFREVMKKCKACILSISPVEGLEKKMALKAEGTCCTRCVEKLVIIETVFVFIIIAMLMDYYVYQALFGSDSTVISLMGIIGIIAGGILLVYPRKYLENFKSTKNGKDAIKSKIIPFYRTWCVVEVAAAIESKIPIVIKSGTVTREFRYDTSTVGDMIANFESMIDVESSECTNKKDEEREMNRIRALPGGARAVNQIVAGVVTGARICIDVHDTLVDAAVCGEEQWLDDYLSQSVQSAEGQTPPEPRFKKLVNFFKAACAGGRLNIVQLLLRKLKNHPEFPLCDLIHSADSLVWATKGGHTNVVKLLLDQDGVDVNEGNVLSVACDYARLDLVDLFLQMDGSQKKKKSSMKEYPVAHDDDLLGTCRKLLPVFTAWFLLGIIVISIYGLYVAGKFATWLNPNGTFKGSNQFVCNQAAVWIFVWSLCSLLCIFIGFPVGSFVYLIKCIYREELKEEKNRNIAATFSKFRSCFNSISLIATLFFSVWFIYGCVLFLTSTNGFTLCERELWNFGVVISAVFIVVLCLSALHCIKSYFDEIHKSTNGEMRYKNIVGVIDPNKKTNIEKEKNDCNFGISNFRIFSVSPLWIAREKGHAEIVQRLLQHPGIHMDTRWTNKKSPIAAVSFFVFLIISFIVTTLRSIDINDSIYYTTEHCYNTGCGISVNNTCENCTYITNETDCSTSNQCVWNFDTFMCEDYTATDCLFEDTLFEDTEQGGGWEGDQWYDYTCTDWSANCKKDKLIKECSAPLQRDSDGIECEIGGFGPDFSGQYYSKTFMDNVRNNCKRSCNCARLQDVCNFNMSKAFQATETCAKNSCGDSNTTCQVCGTQNVFRWNAWLFQLAIIGFCWFSTLLNFLYLCQLLWPHWNWNGHVDSSNVVHGRIDSVNQDIELMAINVDTEVINEYAEKLSETQMTQISMENNLEGVYHEDMDKAEEIQLALALSASMSTTLTCTMENQDQQQGDQGGERKN